MTGKELRLRRVQADVKVYQVAIEMGVHASRVSQVEALADVTPHTQRRYLDALGAVKLSKTVAKEPSEALGAA